ncbi:hypothetical protein H8S90_24580 [Olivibacter sp. SDN3]|uniref:hypothetical protein n=1 Tax=Olivibacter sp. SDN3 TaxID=2764720 RepID=UPI001650FC87|nr:hypothetical protein [Olivibacter sp. SDN3]QNL49837.1 hypothetical protein H8S90_24580 [Olivibacter sp. SDN3]
MKYIKVFAKFVFPFAKIQLLLFLFILINTAISLAPPYALKILIDESIPNKDLALLYKIGEILLLVYFRDRQSWINAIEKDLLTWFNVSDLSGWNNPVRYDYYISSIPASYLIDPEGKIIVKNIPANELANPIERYLQKNQ